MKTFVKYDYYIQLFSIIAGVVISIAGFEKWRFMAFYFIAGISQLISFLIKLLLDSKKSKEFIIYGILILPVWISILIVFVLKLNNDATNFLGYILIFSLCYSPAMAFVYVYDCYRTYQLYK
ncbi:hypothetical protein F3J23_14050 [Chryseobacterium sp. Tr-659]|uniref:hypothetical protein n=1 Tax=Chryseobacterium sp. Tr-659 TaxID=2608340 RepID=UPI001423A6EA|nr:hypothetical protein [Chryseobacterium sp. Tr-659]NIF06567.1 hypothetical protein [Chryseobacterium sp. Tr-659]